jgi:hypothetical protein
VKVALALFTGAALFMAAIVVGDWNGDRTRGPIAIQTAGPEHPNVPVQLPPKPAAGPVLPPVAATRPTTPLGTGTVVIPEPPVGTVPHQNEPAPPHEHTTPEQPGTQQPTEPSGPTQPTEPTEPKSQLTKEERKEARRLSKCQIPHGGPTLSDLIGGCSTIGQGSVTKSRESVPPKSADDGDGDAGSNDSKHGKGCSKKD